MGEAAERCRARAEVERLRAELDAAESRLANRGTHVDLLLREKERLWGQLSRERKRCEPKARHPANSCSSPTSSPAKPSRPMQAPNGEGLARSASVGNQPRQGKGGGKSLRSNSMQTTQNDHAVSAAGIAELERRLWHTQRALDKERQSHEETRDALTKCQGSSYCKEEVAVAA